MLVTLEGIDGAGKSTLYERLKTSLSDLNPLFTREPGSPFLGDAVRRAISMNSDPLVEAALFVADHAVHLATVVRPGLAERRLVVSDRYSDSRFAYQEVSLAKVHDNPKEWLSLVHEGWSVRPDMTVLLVVPVDVALSRLSERANTEHFEQKEFLEAVQKNYLRRVYEDPERFLLVDATKTPEEILDFVERSIRQKFFEK